MVPLRKKCITAVLGLSCIVAACSTGITENGIPENETIRGGYYIIIDKDRVVIAEGTDNEKVPYKIIALQNENGYDIILVQKNEQSPPCSRNGSVPYAQIPCSSEELENAAKKLESLVR